MPATATMTIRLTDTDEVRQFIEKMTAYMQYTADLEELFTIVKNDPTVCSKATADECIATLQEKHDVTKLPYIEMGGR